MPTPPPRMRFRIHLSTAIVMMFVAGGLIWANLGHKVGVRDYHFGWPIEVHYFDYNVSTDTGQNVSDGSSSWQPSDYYVPETAYLDIAIDLTSALGIILAAWIIPEWLI